MTFKHRVIDGRRCSLTSMTNRKKFRRRLRKVGVAAETAQMCIQDAAEGLIMLHKGLEDVHKSHNTGMGSHLVWASPKSSPFIVTPIRFKRAYSDNTMNQHTAWKKCRRNIFSYEQIEKNHEYSLRVEGVQEDLLQEESEHNFEVEGSLDHANSHRDESVQGYADSSQGWREHTYEVEGSLPFPAGESSMNSSVRSSDTQTDKILAKSTGVVTDVTIRPKVFCAPKWSYQCMEDLPRKEFRRLTGLTQGKFDALYRFLGGDDVCKKLKYDYKVGTPKTFQSHIEVEDRLFMTLVRLRRGFSLEVLALFFCAKLSQVSTIIYAWIQLMFFQFKRLEKEMCISRHDQKKQKLPACFLPFKNFRMILDSTEVHIQTPYHYQQQGNTWNAYKSDNVILYLIGVTAFGSISFISGGYEGSISDRELFRVSKVMDLLEPGDVILVDKGIIVQDLCDEIGVKVLHPPFLGDRERLSPEEEILCKLIAHARVHVERAIRKVKCFEILNCITNKMLPTLDQIVYI